MAKEWLSKLKSALLEEEPGEGETTPIDADKPLKGQLETKKATQPIPVSNVPVYATSGPGNFAPQNNGFMQPQMTDEQRLKWENFFRDFINKQNDPAPSYHEFISMVDSFGNMPRNQTMQNVFNGFLPQGLTKRVLIDSAKATLAAVQNNAATFQADIDKKMHDRVVLKREAANEKLQQIAKLQQEIEALNTEAMTNEQKLNIDVQGYQMYASWWVNKLSTDISNITDFVQGQ